MKQFLIRVFLSNGEKIGGWLPLSVLKISSVVIAAAVVATSGVFAVRQVFSPHPIDSSATSSSGLDVDDDAEDGLGGKSKEEIQKELDDQVAASNFAISINSNPVFPTADGEGNLNIINPETNTYLTMVEIYTQDNQLIYKSGAIKPNQHINAAKLLLPLDKGEHEATAYFSAYTPDTQKYVGKAGAKIKITILN